MAPTLHIHLLGEFRLTYDATPIESINTPRLQSLLAYLILHRQAPQARTHLAYLFWPDSSEAQARTNLRKAIYRLRQALPNAEAFLNIGDQTIQWRSHAPFRLDVAEFEDAVARVNQLQQAKRQAEVLILLEEAVNLYRGDLLPTCYDEWLLAERERFRHWFFRHLEQLIQLLEDQRDYSTAIRFAQRLLRHDNLHEATYRRLMRLYALSGDRARALRVYHTCATVLQRELAVEPGPKTREVYEGLLKMNLVAAPGPASPTILVAESPLVGRQPEWQKLKAAWRMANQGQAHLVLVTGEAGLGKTRLVEELQAWVGHQGMATVISRSYAAEGRLAYAPVTDWLRSDIFQTKLTALNEIWLTELARLLPELLVKYPHLPRPEPLTESWQRHHLFEALARAVLAVAGDQPLLLVIDDLQWCDPETLAWLRYLLRFEPQARRLIAGAARSDEVDDNHPLSLLLLDLRRTGQLSEIELEPLEEAETTTLARHIAGQSLDPALAAHLYQETEGNPLFVVETVRMELSRGAKAQAVKEETFTPAPPLPRTPAPLPPRVQAVIQARLAQLSPQARDLACLAAIIGRAFTFEILVQATDFNEDILVRGLAELWQRRIIREQGRDGYDFSHDKIRDVVYAGLSLARRRLLHRRVAQALESVYTSDLDAVSGQVAAHYEQAGLPAQAVPYYQRAAQVTHRLYANDEAINYFNKALALLQTVPESSERDQSELDIQIALGPILMNRKGYAAPEVEKVYLRAWELCQRIDKGPQLFPVLWGLHEVYLFQGELQKSTELGEQCLHLAQSLQDPDLLLQAHHALWGSLFYLVKLTAALEHTRQGVALYNPEQHHSQTFFYGGHDPGVCSRVIAVKILWLLGYPDQALQIGHEALALAQELSHSHSLAQAMGTVAMAYQFRREAQAAQEQAEAVITFATEKNNPSMLSQGMILKGWALANQGQVEAGIAQLRRGLTVHQSLGMAVEQLHFSTLLAETYQTIGKTKEGLEALAEAQATVLTLYEDYYGAESCRLKGELLLAQGAAESEIEACFHQAIEIAQRQQAKPLELRAAMSLSRLWQKQGKQPEARRIVADCYGWFSEGLDTPDLQEAKALLEQLSEKFS